MSRKSKLVILGISVFSIVLIALFSYPVVANPVFKYNYFPSDDWETTTPEAQRMNSTVLEEMYEYISDNSVNFQSMLIIRNGYIIEETYLFNGSRVPGNVYVAPFDDYVLDQIRYDRLHHIWSATKSITSLLVGIAIEMGFIESVDQTFFEIFPDKWNPIYGNESKKDITIEHLLTQTSGFNWTELEDAFYIWPALGYSLDYILTKPLVAEPGSVFNYNTGNQELLAAILQRTTGMKLSEFARQYLFEPIGIEDNDWEWDESPWPWGSVDLANITHGGFGIYMTPRAMARIGLLCLNEGQWGCKHVIPEDWIETSIEPHVTEGIFDPTKDYGYLWWLSSNYYAASGFAGQRIIVIPEHDIIVVITAEILDVITPVFDITINNYIIEAVLPPIPCNYYTIWLWIYYFFKRLFQWYG
ncbi:MAG: serine hydrolase domain-containing protein [Promethearchaeota archaeon]